MTKRERVFALIAERQQVEERLRDIDAEIDELFGQTRGRGGGRRTRKEATLPTPRESVVTRGAALPRVANGPGRAPDPIREKIVALAKEGLGRVEIAERLELKGRKGIVQVTNHLYRARQAGRLPKAEASR